MLFPFKSGALVLMKNQFRLAQAGYFQIKSSEDAVIQRAADLFDI